MSGDTRIGELLEKAAAAVTDEEGHFEHKAFVQEFLRLLAEETEPEVQEALHEATAKRLTDAFVNKRKPRKRNDTLFDPGYILPLGDGKRVWMEQASSDDLNIWALLSLENLEKIKRAEADRQEYAADRIRKLNEHDGWRLGRLEREVIGWTEQDVDLDWSDDDLDDGP